MEPLRCFLALLAAITMLCQAPQGAHAQTSSQVASILDEVAPDEPLKVGIGVKIMQITGVDQKAENFGVVARLRANWKNERLAFDPEEAGKPFKVLSGTDFIEKARDYGVVVPVTTIENQQTRSFVKESAVTWFPDGRAVFVSEIIVTLQAPDFDFRRFPFDSQSFFFRLVANLPTEFIQFEPLANASGMGDTLGEEEWVVTDTWTEVDVVDGLYGVPTSRFSLGFSAHRHLLYYWARLFVPVGLLIGIGWANLFLEEYRRRIDIASGNLLAFIAYNFTISGELPRLGYLTFLDALMMAVFIISAASVAYNVALRRLSVQGRETQARAVDWHVTFWGYPMIFIVAIVALNLVFL